MGNENIFYNNNIQVYTHAENLRNNIFVESHLSFDKLVWRRVPRTLNSISADLLIMMQSTQTRAAFGPTAQQRNVLNVMANVYKQSMTFIWVCQYLFYCSRIVHQHARTNRAKSQSSCARRDRTATSARWKHGCARVSMENMSLMWTNDWSSLDSLQIEI